MTSNNDNGRIKLKPELLKNPYIAYPTIILFSIGILMTYMAYSMRFYGDYSFLTTMPISILAIYLLFPVIHDASHGTLSQNTYINEGIGTLAGVPFFFAPFHTWRYIHLRHHRFTNIPYKDPDYWAGGAVENHCLDHKYALPLRWSTQILHYYYFVSYSLFKTISNSLKNKVENVCDLNDLTSKPELQSSCKVLSITALSIFINMSFMVRSYYYNTFWDMCILWVIPSAIGTMILFFLFDYLPHRPYTSAITESKYKTTNMTHGLWSLDGDENPLIAMLTFNQLTYHNIHHLYPKLPFYKYPQVWKEQKKKLIELETPVVTLLN